MFEISHIDNRKEGVFMARKKKIQNITEGWTSYVYLRQAEVPVYPLLWRYRPSVEAVRAKMPKKKRNAARTDHSVEYDHIAYRFLGLPTKAQAEQLRRTSGCARFLWNRMLGDRLDLYRIMGLTVYNTPADYKDLDELLFLNEVDSLALANVQLRLEAAFSDWLSGKTGKPRFKKKNLSTKAYTTNCVNHNIRFEEGGLTLPKVPGTVKIRMHRPVKEGGTVKNVTVTQEPNGDWFFSIVLAYPKEQNDAFPCMEAEDVHTLKILGLDMSLPHMYVDSDGRFPSYELNGITVEFEKWYKTHQAKIAREQRKLSRMVKKSSNYARQCKKISGLYAKTKHRRSDFLHQMACRLARAYDVIAVEDLNMAAMKRSLNFGRSVSDNAWGTFLTILEGQCKKYGHMLLFVSKWFPSTKTCLSCGYIHKEITLKDRTYICPSCGHAMDRDYQAAINLREEALRIISENIAQIKRIAA